MCGIYDIHIGNDVIGQVKVSREGLYYRFHAVCQLKSGSIFQLEGQWGEKTCRIGILIPEGNQFCLNTKIPAKQFPTSKPIFCAVPRHAWGNHEIPVYPDEPFLYLSKIKNAYMIKRNERAYIVIKNSPDGKPSGE